MRTRSRTRLVSVAAAAALALAALTGCAAQGGGASSGLPPAAPDAAEQAAQAPANNQGSSTTALEDRAVVTTGEMGIRSADVGAASAQVTQIVADLGGRIDARSEQTGTYVYTSLTVRVPADRYDALVEELRGVGSVEYVETSVVDVTTEQVDLDARIASLEASVTSLRQMLAQATNVSDMLEVEATLSDREAELQSLKAQRAALADQVAMSTLYVKVSNDELANPTEPDNGGFFGGLQAGWNALLGFFSGLLTVFGFMLPGLVVLAILGAIVLLIVRAALRSQRSRRAAGPNGAAPAMGGMPAGAQPHGDVALHDDPYHAPQRDVPPHEAPSPAKPPATPEAPAGPDQDRA